MVWLFLSLKEEKDNVVLFSESKEENQEFLQELLKPEILLFDYLGTVPLMC